MALTLLSFKQQILVHFLTKDVFCKDDFNAINVEKEYAEKKDDLTRAALEALEKDGFIKSAGENFWVLTQPIGMAGQDVHLSLGASLAIAGTINAYLDANSQDGDRANPLSLGEDDIAFLLEIIDGLLDSDPTLPPDFNTFDSSGSN